MQAVGSSPWARSGPRSVDLDGLREFLFRPKRAIRTITLYAGDLDLGVTSAAARAADLFPVGSPIRRHYEDDHKRLPELLAAARLPQDLELPESPPGLEVGETWALAFRMPFGCEVLALALEVHPDRPAAGPPPMTRFIGVLDAQRDEITAAGEPWPSVLSAGAEPAVRLGADFHHLTFLPDGMLAPAARLDADRVQRLVSRRDEPSRLEHLTVRLPPEPNRYHDMLAGITPGASIVAGHPPAMQLAFALSAVQALAALGRLRTVQRDAHDLLSEMIERRGGEREAWREWLVESAEELSRLELRLSFGVEAHLAMRLYVPILPLEQYHSELLAALGVPAGLRVTDRMLARLSAAMTSERAAVETAQRGEDERRWRTWSAVGGSVAAVAVPLTLLLAFLGVNATEVQDEPRSIFDLHHYWPYYVALVVLVFAAGAAGHAYGRRSPSA